MALKTTSTDRRLIYGNGHSGLRRREREVEDGRDGKFVAINDFTLFDRHGVFSSRTMVRSLQLILMSGDEMCSGIRVARGALSARPSA